MGRAQHVLANLDHLQSVDAQIIVVDYSCPQDVGALVERHHPRVQVLRVSGKRFFDISDARNAGLSRATGKWVFFLDADILLDKCVFEDEGMSFQENCFFLLGRFREAGAFGSLLAPLSAIQAIGGYDSRYAGYGGEDIDIFERLIIHGLEMGYLHDQPLKILQHSVEDRVKFFKEKNRKKSLLINRVYSHIKINLIRFQYPRKLSEKDLDKVRVFCEEQVEAAMQKGDGCVRINLTLSTFLSKYLSAGSQWQRLSKRNNTQKLVCEFRI